MKMGVGRVSQALLDVLGGDEASMDRAITYGIDPVVRASCDQPGDLGLRAEGVWRRQRMFQILDAVSGCDVLALKGEALSVMLFDDPFMRRSGDIDLLVRWDDVHQWASAIESLGYVSMFRAGPEPWLYDQWAFVDPESALVVEIHWAIAPPPMPVPTFETLWQARSMVKVGDRMVATLSPGHTLVHLCYHFHHHAGFLKGLMDVAGWCDRFGQDGLAVQSAVEMSRALGVEPMMAWPLEVLSSLIDHDLLIRSVWMVEDLWLMGVVGWTGKVIEGALTDVGDIAGGSSLAFKTHDVMQAQVMLWQMLGFGAVSSKTARVGLLLFPVWRSPWVFMAARGGTRIGVRDVVNVCMRPWSLVKKSVGI